MNKQSEILYNYAHGKLTATQANEELVKARLNICIDPNRCKLTNEQIANGWGLLDTGTGSLDPAQMVNGELVNVDCGNTKAFFYQNGKKYAVHGSKLEEII